METFRIGRDGVSEVLVASTAANSSGALGEAIPAGCSHYSASVGGKTFTYAVRQDALSGIANQARALNVKAAGYASVNVWSVVYRASGFVGAVTVVGPDASEQNAKIIAAEAYAHAKGSLA